MIYKSAAICAAKMFSQLHGCHKHPQKQTVYFYLYLATSTLIRRDACLLDNRYLIHLRNFNLSGTQSASVLYKATHYPMHVHYYRIYHICHVFMWKVWRSSSWPGYQLRNICVTNDYRYVSIAIPFFIHDLPTLEMNHVIMANHMISLIPSSTTDPRSLKRVTRQCHQWRTWVRHRFFHGVRVP